MKSSLSLTLFESNKGSYITSIIKNPTDFFTQAQNTKSISYLKLSKNTHSYIFILKGNMLQKTFPNKCKTRTIFGKSKTVLSVILIKTDKDHPW